MRIDYVREVEWQRGYLWELKFLGQNVPEQFKKWFPAVSVEENLWSLESYDFSAGMSTYKLPKGTAVFDLKISFFDDENIVIQDWLQRWVNQDILLDGKGLQYLKKACRLVQIYKLNSRKQRIRYSAYAVYPEGAGYYSGSSDSDAPPSEVTFIISQVIYRNEPVSVSADQGVGAEIS